jgi:hypothetical protein
MPQSSRRRACWVDAEPARAVPLVTWQSLPPPSSSLQFGSLTPTLLLFAVPKLLVKSVVWAVAGVARATRTQGVAKASREARMRRRNSSTYRISVEVRFIRLLLQRAALILAAGWP